MLDYNKFSVLLSIYSKESSKNFKRAMESIYDEQELKPNEIVLVEDGPLTEELYFEIENQKKKLGEVLKIVKLKENRGLGVALEKGILECRNELVARMDTDDISMPTRFKEQIEYLKKNKDIDVLGTYMSEFVGDEKNIICIKDAPLSNFGEYIKYRDPLNHPTVIFKKSKVIKAGNYQEILLDEDSPLWRRMIVNGAKFANLPKSLLYFRITDETYRRRGGWKYIKAEYLLQKESLKLGIINKKEFIINIVLKSIIRLLPNYIRKIVYLKILRRKKSFNIIYY